jgi:TolA-binding protein
MSEESVDTAPAEEPPPPYVDQDTAATDTAVAQALRVVDQARWEDVERENITLVQEKEALAEQLRQCQATVAELNDRWAAAQGANRDAESLQLSLKRTQDKASTVQATNDYLQQRLDRMQGESDALRAEIR